MLDIFRRKEYVVTVDARSAKEAVQRAIREQLRLPAYEPPSADQPPPGPAAVPGPAPMPGPAPGPAFAAAWPQALTRAGRAGADRHRA